uniref:Uncharacterized protein n=1 Tax=Oryzias latipes TaxID=8090 RepID=A0A3P9MF87_ORYLA
MFVSIFLLWLCFFFILFQFKLWRPKNFPPGPLSLPVLGNLLHLNLKNPLPKTPLLGKTDSQLNSLLCAD